VSALRADFEPEARRYIKFTFLVGQSCRSALNSWAATQRRPTQGRSKVAAQPRGAGNFSGFLPKAATAHSSKCKNKAKNKAKFAFHASQPYFTRGLAGLNPAGPYDMEAPLLILASASPRRSELLRQLRPRFHVVPSTVAETREQHWSAGELARINACRKARAISTQFPDALVIGVDTLVAAGPAIFGKPRSRTEARDMLAFLQGRTHQVTTGVCLICWRARRQKVFCEQTDVTFRPLTPAKIRRYHRAVNPLDKAGAYGIQENGAELVESISGSFTNVVGLPLEKLGAELDSFLAALAIPRPPALPFAPGRPSRPASDHYRGAGA